WSMTPRCFLDRTPLARNPCWAATVVSRSSKSRTGVGASRAASSPANSRASAAAGPCRPDSDVGSPTTTSIASYSAAISAMRRRSPLPRLTVSTGVASVPEGSLRATPMRTDPTSMPSRVPNLMSAELLRDGLFDEPQRVADRLGTAAAALRDVVLAATATSERLGGDADQSPGLEPALASRLVHRGDHHGPVGGDAGDHDDRRPVGREPAAYVQRELTQIIGGGAIRRAVCHDGHAARVGRLAGQLAPHAAHARADRLLAQHLDQAELAGAVDVGAAAELAGVVADLDHPDLVAVLLAEHRQRAHRPGLGLRGVEGVDLQVVDEHGVDLVLDVAQHALRDRARGGEVEAEPAGRVLRTGLGRRLAERVLEAAVDHVGGAVAARDRAPPLQVDLGVRLVADLELAAADLAAVDDEPLDRRLHVEDLDFGAAGADDPLVGELAAALGVERGTAEHDLDGGARARGGDRDTLDEDPDHGGVGRRLVVAEELDLARLLQEAAEDGDVGVAGLLRRRVGLGPLAPLLHEAAEALLVDLEPLL